MDLTYGGEYERFRNEVRDFIATHRDAAPDGQGMRSEKTRAWQKMLIERGYTARTIPREYGGYGGDADILKSRIIAEEFAQAQVPAGLGGQGISMLVPTLLEMGTEEQKREFIAPTLRGETIWCQGYSEPGAGSDLASLRTRAELDGDEWVVNGQKIWTSTAQHADWIFCLVRTEPNAPKHQGISFLLFSMKTPGIEVRPLKTMTGDATFNEVFFTDVRVPKGQIVGRRGEGWLVANSILRHERSSLGDPNAMLTRLNALTELMKTETRRRTPSHRRAGLSRPADEDPGRRDGDAAERSAAAVGQAQQQEREPRRHDRQTERHRIAPRSRVARHRRARRNRRVRTAMRPI